MMNERMDEGEPIGNLDTSAFILKNLSSKLIEDSNRIIDSNDKLALHINRLQAELHQLRKDNHDFNASIKQLLGSVKNELYQRIGEQFDLQNALVQNKNAFKPIMKTKMLNRFTVILLLGILCGAILNGLISHQYPFKKNPYHNAEMHAGQLLMRSWNKLSKEEKQHIIKLGTDLS